MHTEEHIKKSTGRKQKFEVLLASPVMRKLILMTALVGLLPSLFVFAITYTIGSRIIQNNAQTDAYGALDYGIYNVQQTVDAIDEISLGLRIDDDILTLLQSKNLRVGSINRNKLRNILESAYRLNRSQLSLICIETEEDIVYTSLSNTSGSLSSIQLYGSEKAEEVFDHPGSLYWFSPDDSSSGTSETELPKYVRCSSAIYDSSTGENIGLLSLFVLTSAFEEDLSYLSGVREDEIVLLLDQNRQVIASNTPVAADLRADLADRSFSVTESGTTTLNDVTYLISSKPAGISDWHLVSLMPRDSVLHFFQSGTALMLFPLVFLPLLCLLSVYLFSSQLLSAISPLIATMREITKGNLKVRSPFINDGTLDLIVNALNETLDKYDELVKKNSHQEALLTIARLKLLRGQLSPHFLCNTLDSVNWMLIDSGQVEMSQIISDLGYLLRYSINETPETVLLKEELDIVSKYLAICKNRFESRLQYSTYLDKDLQDYKIPRFLLQPVVENAIVHGVEKCSSKGIIHIRCYRTDTAVHIDITNNGPTIPDEVKQQLLHSFQRPDIPSNHIGLANVYERIQLYAGSSYGLSLLDAVPQGVPVRMTLPLSPPSDAK